MKKAFLVLMLLGLYAMAFAQVTPKWTSRPVKADGKTNEWQRPFDNYDNTTKLMFSVTFDSKNLYLCFESADPTTHIKVMRAGLTVTLTAKGKEKHRGVITYPALDNKGKPIAPTGLVPGQKIDLAAAHALFVLNNNSINADGFATKNGIVNMNDTLGVHAGIRWDSTNKMVYEVVIPFSEFYGAGFAPEELGKEITMTVEINAMERPNFSPGGSAGDDMINTNGVAGQQYGGMNSPGAMGSQGTMGQGGMGQQGGMMGQPGAVGQPNTQMNRPDYPTPMERNVLYEKASFKEKFILAKKK
jgi:hypothetical protein